MKFEPGASDKVMRRDAPAAGTRALPSERVIKLLGSGDWALLIEALAMGDTRTVRTRRRAHRVMQSQGDGNEGLSAGDRQV
jgi:hypothetical protein